jgi:mannose-6-phosphate isomerase-like protein (cupin superfamily)
MQEQAGRFFVVQPGATSPNDAGVLASMGVTMAFKAVAADTGGAFSVFDYQAPPSFPGAPAHWHGRMTEAFYILRGRLAFVVDGNEFDAGPGAFVLVQPRVVHAWRNPDPQPAQFLVVASPGGFEAYMHELMAWVKAEPTWPPKDPAKYIELGRRHDTYPPE